MTTDAPWTIKRLMEWTTEYLGSHGADTPRLDAEILLGHALGCPRIQLYVRYDECPEEAVRARFREAIKQRAKGMPVAYLTGEKEFFSLRFKVTPDVLIPRPETEYLVVAALDALRAMNRDTPRVLDLGTGSGAIAIVLANQLKQLQVVATDLSDRALAVAQANATALGVADRIEFRHGDLWDPVGDSELFDVIVSNPPYIGLREKSSLMVDVVAHEPHLALFSGEDGTEISKRLISGARNHLLPGGWLMFETSPLIVESLEAELQKDSSWTQVSSKKDLAGHKRVVMARYAAT